MASFYEEVQKSKIIDDEKENIESRANVDKWIFRLLLLVLGLMPLIVLAHIEQVVSPMISNLESLVSGSKGDLFTHYKAIFVLVITVITSILLLIKIFFMGGKIRKTKLNYLLAILSIIIVVSTIISPNITVALHGLYNRSDGAISWLCYIGLLFIAMNIEYPKNVIKYILYTMMPFVVINLFIILMNFYDKDLLQYGWIRNIISLTLPEGGAISDSSQLVGTLNQWNYMSGMFSIMTVLYLMAAVLEKNKAQLYNYLLVSLMSFAVLLMSLSTSGFLTFILLFPIIIYVALKSNNKLKPLLTVIIFILVSIPIFHILASNDSKVWSESIGFIVKKNPYMEEEKSAATSLSNYKPEWITKAYAAEKFELPELPTRSTGAGSGRLYIWSKTIDLVKERPLLGYGMDTLIYNFPHNNIDARANFWYDNIITDKPHSIYIGWLYGLGIIGFTCAIGLVLSIILKSLKEIRISNNPILWIIGVSWSAYLIQGVFNDSIPSISAPMWILAGIMITFTHKEIKNGRNT